ncbi:hypothetical protein [Ottowia sp.]|uniref:hypothetical protein n=1 Tax=Ottowia sp. TaxID=1898956 RepID=UPI003A84D191
MIRAAQGAVMMVALTACAHAPAPDLTPEQARAEERDRGYAVYIRALLLACTQRFPAHADKFTAEWAQIKRDAMPSTQRYLNSLGFQFADMARQAAPEDWSSFSPAAQELYEGMCQNVLKESLTAAPDDRGAAP